MADSLESTCLWPDDAVVDEHPEKALRCMFSEILEELDAVQIRQPLAVCKRTRPPGEAPNFGSSAGVALARPTASRGDH